MKNIEVIKLFVNGEVKVRTKNLFIKGNNLINYSTIIAKRTDKGLIEVNNTKYSQSTSTIQNALKRELQVNSIQYVEIEGDKMNA